MGWLGTYDENDTGCVDGCTQPNVNADEYVCVFFFKKDKRRTLAVVTVALEAEARQHAGALRHLRNK
jgi:hypothetical protein